MRSSKAQSEWLAHKWIRTTSQIGALPRGEAAWFCACTPSTVVHGKRPGVCAAATVARDGEMTGIATDEDEPASLGEDMPAGIIVVCGRCDGTQYGGEHADACYECEGRGWCEA